MGEKVNMLTNERLNIIKRYRTVCSEIIEGRLYLGGYQVACDWNKLEKNKITHIINVSGDVCKNVFQNKLEYRTYYVLDTPQESIEGVLYDSIEWIDAKFKESNENRIYVHCQEGVSRSSSIVIGYLMWKYNKSFNDASEYVRERRGTSSPNIGFTYQLLLFQKALSLVKFGIPTRDEKEEGGGEKAELPSIDHLGKKHWITSSKIYYISKHGIPVSLIHWKGDGSNKFSLNSNKIYLLRQSLLEEADSIRREKLWIWIGSQVNEGVRESILAVLRFCRQILKIEIGYDSSLELENLEIRADLIIGALADDRNSASECITNILSSTIILEYFHEFSESGEFMQILAPTDLHLCNSYDVIQRSFSSPSIKSISKNAIILDYENDVEDEAEDVGVDNNERNYNQIDRLSSDSKSSSELSSLISLDESLPYFSSFPSSNGSPIPSKNSPDNFKSSDTESIKEMGRINQHHFSLDSRRIIYSRDNLLEKESREIESCPLTFGKVVIPKLNFAFKGGDKSLEDHSQSQESEMKDLKVHSFSTKEDSAPVKKQHSIHFFQEEVFCFNNSSYSKRSSISQENLSMNEDCHSTLDSGRMKVLLFRFPDYFGSESLRFFDSEDLLPTSVCPLIIIGEITSDEQKNKEKEEQKKKQEEQRKDKEKEKDKEQTNLPLSPLEKNPIKNIMVYLWIGSKTTYFNQAKQILSEHFQGNDSHNHADVSSLILSTAENQSLKDYEKTNLNEQINNHHFELDITQLLILLIRNNSKLSIKEISSIYFEFEGEESNSFWNYFYQ